VLCLELLYEVVDHPVVEVLTTEVSVTDGDLDLEDALLDSQQRHIEGATMSHSLCSLWRESLKPA
jgi:hypothetical protein